MSLFSYILQTIECYVGGVAIFFLLGYVLLTMEDVDAEP